MRTRIRDAVPDDAEAIAHVHVATWQAAYRGVVDQAHLDGLSESDRALWWAQKLADLGPQQVVVSCRPDGAITGFVTGGPGRDDDCAGGWEVYAIYVLPAAWGGGDGPALFAEFLARVPSSAPSLTLWVAQANERARAFYERRGMRLDGRSMLDTIGSTTISEVRYRLDLAHDLTTRPGSSC